MNPWSSRTAGSHPRPQTRANHADSTGMAPRFEDHGRLPVSRIPKTAHCGRDKGAAIRATAPFSAMHLGGIACRTLQVMRCIARRLELWFEGLGFPKGPAARLREPPPPGPRSGGAPPADLRGTVRRTNGLIEGAMTTCWCSSG